jgi:hypothetical protein
VSTRRFVSGLVEDQCYCSDTICRAGHGSRRCGRTSVPETDGLCRRCNDDRKGEARRPGRFVDGILSPAAAESCGCGHRRFLHRGDGSSCFYRVKRVREEACKCSKFRGVATTPLPDPR